MEQVCFQIRMINSLKLTETWKARQERRMISMSTSQKARNLFLQMPSWALSRPRETPGFI
jgi:hypothetical protein